jgi:hypothetical protein
MTLLTILGGSSGVAVVEAEADITLRDYTIYAVTLRDFTVYSVSLRDYTIYSVTLTDREST